MLPLLLFPTPALADCVVLLHGLARSEASLLAMETALQAQGYTVVNEGYPFAYLRGGTHLIVLNPRREPARYPLRGAVVAGDLLSSGVALGEDAIDLEGFGYGVFIIEG